MLSCYLTPWTLLSRCLEGLISHLTNDYKYASYLTATANRAVCILINFLITSYLPCVSFQSKDYACQHWAGPSQHVSPPQRGGEENQSLLIETNNNVYILHFDFSGTEEDGCP